jgi:GNAT superfamily N-acetyltransferase
MGIASAFAGGSTANKPLRPSTRYWGPRLMAITARPVAEHDLKLICEHRERMFAASGRTRESLRPMTAAVEQWLAPRLGDGSYFGWMLEEAGVVIAGLGMMIIDWPPHPSHPTDHRRAYILNVFVEPEHRGKGLATQLMALAEARARELGVGYAILHSTKQGRPLYERLGWGPTSEMAIRWE